MHPPYSKKQEKSAMETSEILKRVRQIEIKTRGLSNNIFALTVTCALAGMSHAHRSMSASTILVLMDKCLSIVSYVWQRETSRQPHSHRQSLRSRHPRCSG
jgi:hypothetical protein